MSASAHVPVPLGAGRADSVAATAGERNPNEATEDSGERFTLKPHSKNGSVSRAVSILIAEDNPGDVLLVRLALEEHGVAGTLTVVSDGESAVRFLQRFEGSATPCPDLLILDLNLPKKSGYEVLQTLRLHSSCPAMPVVILSSSDAARDFAHASPAGVRHYLRKPLHLEEFLRLGAVFRATLSSRT